MSSWNKYALSLLGAVFLPMWNAKAADDSDLLNLSLKQLSDIEITSVSKRTEKASQAAAAIYVITQEDIRRSGLQSIPELLRMVPGLQVARSGAQNWAIASRGFDGQFSNKLLVLIDGRTVYSPVFSGVFWDAQSMMLEDIDRIEVIRGPGATLWGANAVNGVINIISKNSKDSQGNLVSTSFGNDLNAQVGARRGGKIGDMSYRVYAQHRDQNQQHLTSGAGADDDWYTTQGGFRMDWNESETEQKTLQGDVYVGREGATRLLPVTTNVSSTRSLTVADTDNMQGANILGRWKHQLSEGSDITAQAYYDDVYRKFGQVGAGLHTYTWDADIQHNLKIGERHNLTWGLGYRLIQSDYTNSFYIGYVPQDFISSLYSGFVQDKIFIIPDKLAFTLGTKVEHNEFSGLEYEPSARLAWTPDSRQTLWTAVSRAVRAKTQSSNNLNLTLGAAATPAPNNVTAATTFLAEVGNKDSDSEYVNSYEIGYRIQPKDNLSFDVTAFVNEYKKLASLSTGPTTLQNNAIMGNYFYRALVNTSYNRGETHGVETAATWEVTPRVKLSGSYTLFVSALHIVGSSLVTKEGTAPKQQFNARAYVDLSHDVQWDSMVYMVDSLPGLGVPGYARYDTRLGWAAMPGLNISLIGQNLFDDRHQEYTGFLYQGSEEIGRSVVAQAALRF